jgi:type IV secretory pathway VirB10-like protein
VEKVTVNKRLLIGVVGVAAAALLALAFVLGRESGSGSVSAPPTRIERVAPRAREEPVSPPTPTPVFIAVETRPASGPAPSAPEQRAVLQTAASQAPAPIGGESGNAASDPERAAVAAYFDAVDHIQAGAVSGEPDAVANEMAAALANGDTSGLDKMIRQTEAAKASLAAITPPAPCVTHHRESLASLDDALEVLRSMKTAMESSDPVAQLANVSAKATALRSRADVLQKEEQALRQRYGLKR